MTRSDLSNVSRQQGDTEHESVRRTRRTVLNDWNLERIRLKSSPIRFIDAGNISTICRGRRRTGNINIDECRRGWAWRGRLSCSVIFWRFWEIWWWWWLLQRGAPTNRMILILKAGHLLVHLGSAYHGSDAVLTGRPSIADDTADNAEHRGERE